MPYKDNYGDGICCPDGSRFDLSDECENDLVTDEIGLTIAMQIEIKFMWGSKVPGGIGNGNPVDSFNSIVNTCSVNGFLPSPGDVY